MEINRGTMRSDTRRILDTIFTCNIHLWHSLIAAVSRINDARFP